MNFKNKEELDNMSKQEIKDFRYDLIKNHYDNSTKEYLEELEFYTDVRFSDEIYSRYDRWIEQINNGDDEPALKLIVKLLNKEDGKNSLYYMGIISGLKNIGTFKYIKGVNIEIPEKYFIF